MPIIYNVKSSNSDSFIIIIIILIIIIIIIIIINNDDNNVNFKEVIIIMLSWILQAIMQTKWINIKLNYRKISLVAHVFYCIVHEICRLIMNEYLFLWSKYHNTEYIIFHNIDF